MLEIFSKSGLDNTAQQAVSNQKLNLSKIWLKTKTREGHLGRKEFFTALKLIAIYQTYNSLDNAASHLLAQQNLPQFNDERAQKFYEEQNVGK